MGEDTNTPPAPSASAPGGVPPIEHVSPLKRFLNHDMVGSGILLFAGLAAVVLVNIGYEEQYHRLWEWEFGFSWGDEHGFRKPLHLWVNDGLMALFFFLVGLEIKRELLAGEIATFRKALLPVVAAIGGMVVPALIYLAFNPGGDAQTGWGIPMATDIAFAAGCIAVLKKWVPPALMVFLVALAIVDDLGAVTVIALFYTDQIDFAPLIVGGSLILISFGLGRLGVRATLPYVVIGLAIWLAFLQSGVHATIAGVLLAFTIPTRARYETHNFEGRMKDLVQKFVHAEDLWPDEDPEDRVRIPKELMVNQRQQSLIRHMNVEAHHVEAPLQRIEHNLEPFCVFIVLPLFAFANAGVHIEIAQLGGLLREPVTLGIMGGLVLGKPIGIVAASFIAVKLGWASLPKGVRWGQLLGAGMLAGIGFTMSLFVNELAFKGADPELAETMIESGKIGIFLASAIAAVVGIAVLKLTCREVQPHRADSGH